MDLLAGVSIHISGGRLLQDSMTFVKVSDEFDGDCVVGELNTVIHLQKARIRHYRPDRTAKLWNTGSPIFPNPDHPPGSSFLICDLWVLDDQPVDLCQYGVQFFL